MYLNCIFYPKILLDSQCASSLKKQQMSDPKCILVLVTWSDWEYKTPSIVGSPVFSKANSPVFCKFHFELSFCTKSCLVWVVRLEQLSREPQPLTQMLPQLNIHTDLYTDVQLTGFQYENFVLGQNDMQYSIFRKTDINYPMLAVYKTRRILRPPWKCSFFRIFSSYHDLSLLKQSVYFQKCK